MSGSIRVLVPAKINLHLGVGPRRVDGYHELITVYQAISVYDEVTACPATRTVLTIDGEGSRELPLDGRNLSVRAAAALAAFVDTDDHVRLHLRKRIPIAGGLAGGSADAAATLLACDALWGHGLPRQALLRLAADLGSDVPFLLFGGVAVGTGRGERITPVATAGQSWHWVVAAAEGGLSTPAVYGELDRLRAAGLAPAVVEDDPPVDPMARVGALLEAVRQDDPAVLGAALHNDLEVAALSLRPELRRTLDAGLTAGAVAGMISGSGPTCVFLAADADGAAKVAEGLGSSGRCRLVRTAMGPVPGAELRG